MSACHPQNHGCVTRENTADVIKVKDPETGRLARVMRTDPTLITLSEKCTDSPSGAQMNGCDGYFL